MTIPRLIILLSLATTSVLCHPARQRLVSSEQPEVVVRRLYQTVVVRQPVGIPYGNDMRVLAPYLSKTLMDRIESARACANDWHRHHPGRSLKPPFAWLEAGLFSGDDERASPREFQIERTEAQKDGAFRVYVKLTWGAPADQPLVWRVVAIVVKEGSRSVVSDVVYRTDEHSRPQDTEWRLTERLSQGCDGSHWVGYVNR